MTILGISCFYHDSSACVVKDGRVIAAAAEERFSRKKHDNGFPKLAIEYCLDALGIAMGEVDLVVFYEKPIIKFERIMNQHLEHFPWSRKTFVEAMGGWLEQKLNVAKVLKDECSYHGKVVYVPHHMAHAASGYYLSGMRKAVIVTIDGVGEWATTTMGKGERGEIEIDREIRFPHSLGLFYSAVTAYLGFKVNNDEYKVMGLAAYGDPKPFGEQVDELIKVFDDGSYALNMDYFDYTWSDHMPSTKMENLFGHKIRTPESKVCKYHEDIAAAAQAKLEEVVFGLLEAAHEKYDSDNLCLAGGVALNSVMNGKILERTSFKKLYVTPDPGDAGGAIGAALYAAKRMGEKGSNKDFYPALGPSHGHDQVKEALDQFQLKYKLLDREDLLDKVSNLIIRRRVVGWFQGRMEWGPRALGQRSILASAADEKMKDVINAKVKKREMFRPFAPVILDKYVGTYFEADKQLPVSAKYMLMVYPFREKVKKKVPAVVHVDGTGRLQVVGRIDNPLYYDLIEAYRKKTGIPIIINTSFNVRGEPIVCTPTDALKCFLGTEIDYLAIDNYLVRK